MPGYGRTDSEWTELVDAGRGLLVEQARRGTLTSYTEFNAALAQQTGCRPFDFERADERAAMGHLLGLVVQRDQEVAPATPPVMLSALVNYVGANEPGPGFYQLAKELGLLPLGASPDEKFVFWAQQVKRLCAHHGARPTSL